MTIVGVWTKTTVQGDNGEMDFEPREIKHEIEEIPLKFQSAPNFTFKNDILQTL